jgi:hypothetical protein
VHLLREFSLFVVLSLVEDSAILDALRVVHGHVIEQMQDELCLLRRGLRHDHGHGP